MSEELNEKIILEKFDRVSNALQDAITADGFDDSLSRIGAEFNLQDTQTLALRWQTMYVLLGMLEPTRFVARIAVELNVPELRAREIATKVNEVIFRPVKTDIENLYKIQPGASGAKKPLAAELEENVGLRPPEPPKTQMDKKPLSAALEEVLRKNAAAQEIPDPLRTMERDTKKVLEKAPVPTQEENLPPTVPTPYPVPSQSENLQPPTPPRLREVAQGEGENEEELDRTEILKAIENPPQAAPRPPVQNLEKPPQGYRTDPYREPLE